MDLLKKTDWNTKTSEIESKIPSISGSATSSALTAVENKIPDVSSSVKKTNHDVKISEIEKKITDHDHEKYITTNNKLMSHNRKINSNKTSASWKWIKKLQTFDSSYFQDKSHFVDSDGTQNYFVFQP